ncbi:hypothetical protein BDFG_08312 [Blastomyces dermatitidis ATCC 26199]|nr:hypothetical protein BDFG_08312 [Blastomyces dermatitidis ATCC 26199]
MADANNGPGDVADSKKKETDAIFIMECLKHLQTPARQFNLQQHLTCSTNSANGGATTPRKGAKTSTGPIKAKKEPSEEGGEDVKGEKMKPGRKPGAKRGRKPKAAALDEDKPVKPATSGDNNEANSTAMEATA